MMLIKDTYDLICLITGIIGIILFVIQLYLYNWNLEELLFGEDEK